MTAPYAVRRPSGFSTPAEFFGAVRRKAETGIIEPKLQASATAQADEAVGADGGYLVPADFVANVFEGLAAQQSIISKTTMIPSRTNSVQLPIDVEPDYSTYGPQLKPVAEAGSVSQSKLKVQLRSIRLPKIGALVPVTNELLEDAPGLLEPYMASALARRLDFLLMEHILRGDGVNKSLGILNSGALITVSKESAQSGTVVIANIEKMLARLAPSARADAVWLIHTSVEQQLLALVGAGAGHLFRYVDGDPFMRLCGLPVIPLENCSALGVLGDIVLVSFRGIALVYRQGLIKQTLSAHVFFDVDSSAFRFDVRAAAMPLLGAPVSQAHGGSTVSTVVTLEARP